MKDLRESKKEGDGNRPNVKNDYVTAYRQITAYGQIRGNNHPLKS